MYLLFDVIVCFSFYMWIEKRSKEEGRIKKIRFF